MGENMVSPLLECIFAQREEHIMIKSFQKFSLGSILVLSLATAGCVPLMIGAAAGAGGITYAKGALVRNVNKPVSKVHKASLSALKSLELFITDDELNRHSAYVKAEYATGKKVKISIEALTERATKITIRVGIIGNQAKSQAIFNAIHKKL